MGIFMYVIILHPIVKMAKPGSSNQRQPSFVHHLTATVDTQKVLMRQTYGFFYHTYFKFCFGTITIRCQLLIR